MSWLVGWLRDSPLATATWVDALDVAVLAWLVYRVLLLIQGTRAMQSLLGLGLLGVVYLASDLFGLTTLHWVLDNLFVYVILVLLILFQDDLRRALARAGGTLFYRGPTQPSDANLLQEVIKAVFNLAQRKVGALVAIERTAALEPYVGGAQALDAEVSAELLQSVFHPSSPLHDGAVVIARNRVVAAGVFLPISLAKDVSKAYGTRHRAAIGLTEATDAVCLVVSEERGTVALVQYGSVVPVADAGDLRQRLTEGLERAPVKGAVGATP